MPPKVNKTDAALAEELGLEFGTPPEPSRTRTSKHDERWAAARDLSLKYPGQSLKVLTYNQASQPYSTAKAINNAEHRHFTDNADMSLFKAVAAKNEDGTYSIWLTYVGE